ncbi:hypothetical protein ACSFV5_04690 [Acinetobacter sp. HC8-3S]|nr:hypothetical protein [Acinetobacter proteolyticus]WEI18433.1 hypothetical protein PY247_19950 [Acinetobacter proteolyticus]
MIKTDILVIGSGFGGAVCAARLVDAGKKLAYWSVALGEIVSRIDSRICPNKA